MLTSLTTASFVPSVCIEQLVYASACAAWLGMHSLGAPSLSGEVFSTNNYNTDFRKTHMIFYIFTSQESVQSLRRWYFWSQMNLGLKCCFSDEDLGLSFTL